MSTPENRLSRFHDGDLTDEESAALERELENDTDLRAKLAGLAHLSDLVKAGIEPIADDAPTEDMWGAIQARLKEPAANDAPAAETAPAPETAQPKLRVVKGGGSRSRVWVPIAAAIAIAAAALLVVYRPWARDGTTVPNPPEVAQASGSEIEEVDFGYSTGAVFSIEGDEGEHYAVIWISDEKIEEEEEQPPPP